MEPRYKRYEAKDMTCEGTEKVLFEKPVEMKMEIGSFWRNYIVFPNCDHLIIDRSGKVYCDVKGENRCYNLSSSVKLKRKFFPDTNVFGREPLD